MLPPSSVSGIRFGGTESFCSGGSVMSGRTVLEIKDLSKSFGKNKVLDGINLKVEEGTVCGLMGENGAGKSTMMKCLFGIYAKDEGQHLKAVSRWSTRSFSSVWTALSWTISSLDGIRRKEGLSMRQECSGRAITYLPALR